MFRFFAMLACLVFSAACVRAPDLPQSPDPLGRFRAGLFHCCGAKPRLANGLQGLKKL